MAYKSFIINNKPVLRIRIRIRIRRIRMCWGLLDPDPLVRGKDPDPDPLVRGKDPDPDPLVRGKDPDPDPYPSLTKQNSMKP